MIKKLNPEGRVALITSNLLLAPWAPITTNAQPNVEFEPGKYTVTAVMHECAHCKLLHSSSGRTCPHRHHHTSSRNNNTASLVGFAEVDPAAPLFEKVDFDAVASEHQVTREYVGFAEADPTDFGAPVISINPLFADRSAWQNPIGFAETDPADIEGAKEAIPNEILVGCQHMGTSSSYPSAIEFPGVSLREDHS